MLLAATRVWHATCPQNMVLHPLRSVRTGRMCNSLLNMEYRQSKNGASTRQTALVSHQVQQNQV